MGQPYPKSQQLHSVRIKPKRGKFTKFSTSVRKAIIKRDRGRCVRCGSRYDNIHHVQLASQGGPGTIGNGVCVCFSCHEYAHSGREGREWFERYRDLYLKEENQ